MNRTVASLFGLSISIACMACVGPVTDSKRLSNGRAAVRVDRHEEVDVFLPGAYLKFYGKSADNEEWTPLFTFRHDDPIPIPQDCVRFVSADIAYAFVGWYYTVTTDAGHTWSTWKASHYLPNWRCCNYRLIRDVTLSTDGSGSMVLNPIPSRRGEVPELATTDFGKHWLVPSNSVGLLPNDALEPSAGEVRPK
jgi:hypothetical protein